MQFDSGIVIGLLSLLVTIDLAQFTMTLRHERRLSRLATIENERKNKDRWRSGD